MDHLVIDRLHATYHIDRPRVGVRERLDRILEDVVATGLDEALERSRIADDEEVCVRSVAVPVTLSLDGTDQGLRDAWGAALLRALEQAIDQGGPNVIRFQSRGHAYVDLALGVARGDLRHAWAWRQLGIAGLTDGMSAVEAHREAARALAATPSMILPALRAVGAEGCLGEFLAALGSGGLLALAGAAVVVAAPAESGRWTASWARGSTLAAARADGAGNEAADRIVRTSPVAVAARATSGGLEPSVRRALAVLAILDADPAALHGGARANALVGAVAARLGSSDTAHEPTRLPLRPAEPAATVEATQSGADPAAIGALALADGASPDAAVGDHRIRGWTDRAGVLYLVHLVSELGLAVRVAGAQKLAGRPARWWLHRLAVELASTDDADPAVLAFVGLGPDARPPSADVPPADAAEQRQVRRLANAVALALARRLDRGDEPARVLLAAVCDRRAEIVADPGWLEVRMTLDAVDLAIRRVGLDRDPGFVPWSGVVLRFVYD